MDDKMVGHPVAYHISAIYDIGCDICGSLIKADSRMVWIVDINSWIVDIDRIPGHSIFCHETCAATVPAARLIAAMCPKET